MNITDLARKAVLKRHARGGRLVQGEAAKRELDAAGKPPGEHEAFNYRTGVTVKKAAELMLTLLLCREVK